MFGNRMKHCLVFASLISPSKMILFEEKYQTFDTVFHHQMKHLEVRQKYSAARRIFQLSSRCFIWWWNTASHVWYITSNMRRSVSSLDETLRRECKIRHAAEYFWWTSRCFIWWWNTVSNAWCYFSNKMILEGEIKEAKMNSF